MYVNRLLQYVVETAGKHENGAVVQATLKDVDARLWALNKLASKGVHANVTACEVVTCVVQTYRLVADLLRIRERAASLADQQPAHGRRCRCRPLTGVPSIRTCRNPCAKAYVLSPPPVHVLPIRAV